jgi:DNA uptake protein ComE-like DNA-binding protein
MAGGCSVIAMKTVVAAISICFMLLTGCNSPSNTDALRERTADATAAAKRNAGAIAKGIAEGLARKGPTDINTASAKQLQGLPGITPMLAKSILAGRPYENTSQLVRKRILTKPQYNRIRAQIVAKQ